jgi:hypothetical protein
MMMASVNCCTGIPHQKKPKAIKGEVFGATVLIFCTTGNGSVVDR